MAQCRVQISAEHIGRCAQRVVVVANRLPVTISRNVKNELQYRTSSGGLVSVLDSLRSECDFVWYGWPGLELTDPELSAVQASLKTKHNAAPVLLSADVAAKYYSGFSNSLLWPLLHSSKDVAFDHLGSWQAYIEANWQFAKTISTDLKDGDIVWVHDFHLMLVPQMLRELIGPSKRRQIEIKWFLHTPFPAWDVFRLLPMGQELFQGVLEADTVGFHVHEYAQNFVDCGSHLLQTTATQNPMTVRYLGRQTRISCVPVGIDPEQFSQGSSIESTQSLWLKQTIGLESVEKIILGIDRIDRIKGLCHKIMAFAKFLEARPEWVGRVSLLQIAVPSRTEGREYQELLDVLLVTVEEINAKYGHIGYLPIRLVVGSIERQNLVALYALADVCLISSLRDGLNLVALEFIASQTKKRGVLALSRFTGVAHLLNGSILFDPLDQGDFADAIWRSLTLSLHERESNFQAMYSHVQKYTSLNWYRTFIEAKDGPDELAVLPSLSTPSQNHYPAFELAPIRHLTAVQA